MLALAPAALADDVDRYVMQGVDQLYSVRFDDAARSFDQAIAADRSDPRGYFYRANVHLWSYIFDKRQEQLTLFLKVSDQAIATAEAKIRANSRDSRSKLFLGMTYGYKAIANARAENIMAAALSARTCYDKLNDVVRSDPKAYDAYLGLGLFHFIFGSVPKAAQFLTGLGGIKGDAKLGLREIETVASRGTYFRNDAQLIMALLDIYYLNDINKGVTSLGAIAARYPKNVAILYALGTAYLNQNLPDRAIPYLERVIQAGNNDFKLFTDMSYGRCGIAYFQSNDIAHAKPYLQKFIKNSREKEYRVYAWYLLGLCFELEGNRANAIKAYNYAVKSPSSTAPEDWMARRRAKILAATPMSDAGKGLVRALNAAASSHFDDALRLSNAVAARRDLTPAERAQANYAYAQGLQGKGEYARAIEAYRIAATQGRHDETWVQPFSYLHIAECYLKLGDRARWKTNIDLAQTFHDYDMETQLRFLVGRDVTMID
jgi:tetratricopeptide (TPR) repeat protein